MQIEWISEQAYFVNIKIFKIGLVAKFKIQLLCYLIEAASEGFKLLLGTMNRIRALFSLWEKH